jgi:hypothetical protein
MEESERLHSEEAHKQPSYREIITSNGMWIIFILFIISTLVVNFSISLLAIYYIIILDISDELAGILLALLVIQAAFSFLPATLERIIGLKGIYLWSFLIAIVLFIMLILIENLPFQIVTLTILFSYFPSVFFTCILSEIGSRTSLVNRSLAYSMANSVYNFLTVFLGLFYEMLVFFNGLNQNTFRIIFGTLSCLLVFALILIIFFYEPFEKPISNQKVDIWKMINLKRFWKAFAVMMLCSLPIATAFSPGYILPIYMDRELGSTSGFGILYALYFLVSGISSLLLNFTSKLLSLYDNLIVGTGIIALGPLAFLIGNNFFTISLYLALVAIGSGIVGSRNADYLGFAAIKGLEIYFYGIIQISFAVSSLVIGLATGFTLEAFCPEDGERRSWIMWVVIAGYTFLAALMMVLFAPWIRFYYDNQESDPYVISNDEDRVDSKKI